MLADSNEKPLILVVEDEPVTRITLEKILDQSGYPVIIATNGSEGLSQYIEHRPSLVLMDVMMPGMDGYETIQAIRNYETEHAVPILMLTALDDPESIDDAFNSGATDFITKPINWGLLTQKVKYSLRASEIEEQLRTSQSQLIYAQKLAKLGYWEWDAQSNHVSGSKSAFELFGLPSHHRDLSLEQFLTNITPKDKPMIHQAMAELHQGQASIQVSFRVMQPDSSLTHIECLGEAFFDSDHNIIRITGTAQDISRLHKAESLIEYQAEHDRLTDLANRSSFSRTLITALKEKPSNSLSAVIIFDIDRFKQINENLGQEHGDSLLLALANRLNRVTRENDHVARLGSDEFAALLQNIDSASDLNIMINRFNQQLKAPFIINDRELYVSYSFGIAVYPDDANDAETLMNNANVARTKAKKSGGNQYIFFEQGMNENAHEMLSLENDLRKALKNQEIEIFYQPQVNVETLKPTGAEALVRWRHPTRGIVSPGLFIPIAESTGLITDIGNYVLETAIKDAGNWHRAGYQLHVGINLSGRQFSQNNLIEKVQSNIANIDYNPKYIDLEITESLAMSNAEANIQTLKGLKAMGLSISIDDFGTGYSSLAYLQSFPIDAIKIDRSFILNLDSKEGKAIAQTILAMAESLDLDVVAEGIELDEHVNFFRGKHCHLFQGFKFGKPMPEKDFSEWLKSYNINDLN